MPLFPLCCPCSPGKKSPSRKSLNGCTCLAGSNIERMEKLGKRSAIEMLKCKRFLLNVFVERFGNLELQNLTVPMVIDFLAADKHSGSWKKNFLTAVGEVYEGAPFMGLPYIPIPHFPKFRRNSNKKDVFTTDELNILFKMNGKIRFCNT